MKKAFRDKQHVRFVSKLDGKILNITTEYRFVYEDKDGLYVNVLGSRCRANIIKNKTGSIIQYCMNSKTINSTPIYDLLTAVAAAGRIKQ